MSTPSFVLQDAAPLYPKILYNRPITRAGGGRLLVVGGHSHEFSLPTNIYALAVAAGIGQCDVVLPDSLVKFLAGTPGTHFAASSPSGSLGRGALDRILELSEEADAVAIGASLSNNSDTAILTERLVTEIARPIIAFDDCLAALRHNITALTQNPNALLILTMAEVFKLCGALQIPINIRPGGGLINKLEIVRDLKAATAASFAVYGTEIIIAADTDLVVTPINYRLALAPAIFYSVLSTFWLQNRNDRRAGLATGAFVIAQASADLGATARPSVAGLASNLSQVLRQDEF